MRHLVISPCRNEAALMQKTLASVDAQTKKPDLWVIVDDGSTDETPALLARFAALRPWVRVVSRADRGYRAVGPGVVDAFNFGLDAATLDGFDFVTKLDLDLDLPPRYFEIILERMIRDPRIGTASGKPYFRDAGGALKSERRGDEMSVGMTKIYRADCFREIGGFVREVMWDAIDCHSCRRLGWIAVSWDDEDLRFEHLRAMGSSDRGILAGRARHGYGQYFMGSDPLYFLATAIYRMTDRPYVVGGLMTVYGYFKAALLRKPQLDDASLRAFIRRYQRRALMVGKKRATAEFEAAGLEAWRARRRAGASAT